MQATLSAGSGASTLALKPMGRVNQSLKQRVLVVPQNGDLSLQQIKIKSLHVILSDTKSKK